MMRESGPLTSLEDERTERNLIRAIELARAPAAAQQGHPDGMERADGAVNLVGREDPADDLVDDDEEAPAQG